MAYTVTIAVDFDQPRHRVYEALCDLGRYPEWNSGMTHVSYRDKMYEGLKYETESSVLGRTNKASVEVIKLVPDQIVALESHAGLITFRADFELLDHGSSGCSVTCDIDFEFSSDIIKMAHSAVETAAEVRIRGDLEKLRAALGTK